MEGPLCTERDQALLCLIIGECNQLEKRGPVSRRAVMTAFCYARLNGVPTNRRFLIMPQGPVGNDMLLDLEALEIDGSIKNVSVDLERHADYVNGVGSLSLCAPHREWLEEQRPKVRQVLKTMSPMTKAHLEAVACLHFLYLFLSQGFAGEELEARTKQEFRAHVDREGWNESEDLYDSLVSSHLIHDHPSGEN